MAALVRATGFVGLGALAWAVLMGVLAGNAELTKIQLEADPAAVSAVRADAEKLDAARLALHLDFVLLALYGLTFGLLGALLSMRGGRWFSIAGVAVIVGAIVTCVCDVVENVLTLRMLPADGMGAVAQSTLDSLRTVSYAKWGASALTVALVTLLFVGRGRAHITFGLKAGSGGAALLGLAGVAAQSRVILVIYFVVLGVLLVVVAKLFAFWPRTFLRGFRRDRSAALATPSAP